LYLRLVLHFLFHYDYGIQRNTGKLDATSLKALKEMLPTSEEKKNLAAFVDKCGSSADEKEKAYSAFSECEKYMYSMIPVADASGKLECMIFRTQFQARYDEILESVEIIDKSCDEVRTSERLEKVMAIILTLVNQINTGGNGNEAAGFTLDALLKLNEVR
jgi:Formin Homology 2 Domain